MFDRLKNRFFNLCNPAKRIFLQLLNGKYFVDILTEVHPLDPLLTTIHRVEAVHLYQLFILVLTEVQIQSPHYPPKLLTSHDVLPQSIEVKEKLSDSQPLQRDLSLYLLQQLFYRLATIGQSLLYIEFLSEGILVEVHGDVFVGVEDRRIGHHSFNSQSFNCIDVLDIPDKLLVAYLLGVAASSVFP